jgi:hypothetical protein
MTQTSTSTVHALPLGKACRFTIIHSYVQVRRSLFFMCTGWVFSLKRRMFPAHGVCIDSTWSVVYVEEQTTQRRSSKGQ